MDRADDKTDFIRDIINQDLATGKHRTVVTRFPPEPNGYLHIGHAKAICIDFGIAAQYGGRCHLRFDDTNPIKEDVEYVDSIQADVRWLGFDWGDNLFYASDYFERMYQCAVGLIRAGKAYVCSLSEAETRAMRGTLTEPGQPSPYRERSVEENLDLFARMRAGEFPDGTHVLRARIDMAASNMKMRDPLLYRIRHQHHHRTGDDWCIYPMYDYAHPLSDAFEEITHSLCTLEFENNRELYDWVVDNCDVPARPRQYEFARLALDYTVMSKRKLLTLVERGLVDGWDDPRMPTLAGMRRRGFTPAAIRSFCDLIGVSKANSVVDVGKLEFAVRDDLNFRAPRVMCVLDPLKVVLEDVPEGHLEELEAPYFPRDVGKEGARTVPLTRELYIERADFAEDPPAGFHRLVPGGEVRLRHAYVIACHEVIKDADGRVVELRCRRDPATLGKAPAGRKVKGAIHWVSASHGVPCEVRIYDRLFSHPRPDSVEDFTQVLNSDSLITRPGAVIEPSVAADDADTRYQFERTGYFWRDPVDARPDALVFNRIVALRDSWARASAEDDSADAPAAGKSARGKTRPPKRTAAEQRARARAEDPALAAMMTAFQERGVAEQDADLLTGDRALAELFGAAIAVHDDPVEVAKWVVNELIGVVPEEGARALPFDGAAFGRLVALVGDGTVSSAGAKQVLTRLLERGGDPREIVEAEGLAQVSDTGAIEPVIDRVLAANEGKVAAYRGGKTGLLGFFVGQVMKETGGSANPAMVKDLVAKKLG